MNIKSSNEKVTISHFDLQVEPLSYYNILYERKENKNNKQQAKQEKLKILLNVDAIKKYRRYQQKKPQFNPYNFALLLVSKKSDDGEKKWRLVGISA